MWRPFAIMLIIVLTASAAGGDGTNKSGAAGLGKKVYSQQLTCSTAMADRAAWIRRIHAARCDWKRRVDTRRMAAMPEDLRADAEVAGRINAGN